MAIIGRKVSRYVTIQTIIIAFYYRRTDILSAVIVLLSRLWQINNPWNLRPFCSPLSSIIAPYRYFIVKTSLQTAGILWGNVWRRCVRCRWWCSTGGSGWPVSGLALCNVTAVCYGPWWYRRLRAAGGCCTRLGHRVRGLAMCFTLVFGI